MLPQNNFNSAVINKYYMPVSRKSISTSGLKTKSFKKSTIWKLLGQNWEVESKGTGITENIEDELIEIIEAGIIEKNTSSVRDNLERKFKGSWIVLIHEGGCQLSYTCHDEIFITLKNLNANTKILIAKTSN